MECSPKENIIESILIHQIDEYITFGTKAKYTKEQLLRMRIIELNAIYEKILSN
jgi:hypothetical protein